MLLTLLGDCTESSGISAKSINTQYFNDLNSKICENYFEKPPPNEEFVCDGCPNDELLCGKAEPFWANGEACEKADEVAPKDWLLPVPNPPNDDCVAGWLCCATAPNPPEAPPNLQ